MPLDDLLAVCPPPPTPVNPPTPEQWNELETLVGQALPPDYKAFLARYGSGGFGSFEDANTFFDLAYVLSPGQPPDRSSLNAIPLMIELTKTIADIRAKWPALVPSPVWPEPGGLLYAGGTTTEHSIYWKTAGKADAWTCAVSDYGCDNWFEWNDDLTSLLAAIATKRVPDWIVEGPTNFPLVFRSVEGLSGVKLV
jgi:hypothetical protein